MFSPRWVFFDLFDTLCSVDEERYYKGKRNAARSSGLDFDLFMAAWRTTAAEASTGKLDSPFARAGATLAKVGCFDRKTIAEVARLDVETIQGSAFLYDGAAETLAELRKRGFRLGLISNATSTTAFLVTSFNLRKLLDQLVFSYETKCCKPDLRIYRKALSLAETGAGEALFVGDGANHELDAARQLGMATIRIDHPVKALSFLKPESLSDDNHAKVSSFEELLALPFLAGDRSAAS